MCAERQFGQGVPTPTSVSNLSHLLLVFNIDVGSVVLKIERRVRGGRAICGARLGKWFGGRMWLWRVQQIRASLLVILSTSRSAR